jgi:hypothetical protein
MKLSFNLPATPRIALFCATFLLVCAHQALSQDSLEQARQLLQQWSQAQQAQQHQPDEANLKKLRMTTSSVAEEVPELLKRGVIEFLNSPGPHSADDLRQRVSAALRAVPSDEYQPEVSIFQLDLVRPPSYFIAYNVPYCASCSRAWIGIVGKKAGRYAILAETGDSFANKSLHVTRLEPNKSGKDRFLVYGTNWGDAHSRLSASAYVIDGNRLRNFWTRTDLPQGSIKVNPTEITLTFLTALRPPWKERTEVYDILAMDQIKLKKSFEQPAG